jgi:hypothetical protein
MKDMKEERKSVIDNMYETGTFKSDLDSYIKSRVPIYAVNTKEERRFIQFMRHFSKLKGLSLNVWDTISGLKSVDSQDFWNADAGECTDMDNEHTRSCTSEQERVLAYMFSKHGYLQKSTVADYKRKQVRAEVYILLDFAHVLNDPRVVRRLKQICSIDSMMSVVLVGDYISTNMDREMRTLIPNLTAPMPGNKEYKKMVDDMAGPISDKIPSILKEVEENEAAILKSVEGKTITEAEYILANNVVTHLSFLGDKK